VTLLFTDIEGSTRLLETIGSRYGELLQRHHEIIVKSAEEYRGQLVGTQGDGTFLVFPTADEAARAAAGAQRAMARHTWPDGVFVRVRMGMHSGSPVVMEGQYVGIDVHRAARIAAVARGGQVIASATTMELTSAAEVGWVDLGRYRLKDINLPQRLFQLEAQGLEKEFAPLAAPRWDDGIPEPATRFIGRAGDMAALDDMLGRSDRRLVTLVGPGGIGKTRLAISVANRAAHRFRDGTAFVPLAIVTENHEMVTAIGVAAGVAPDSGADDLDALLRQLRDRELLLVLDNLEHLEAAPRIVAELMKECREVVILATSRSDLGLHGENLFPVRPLGITDDASDIDTAPRSDAVTLFIDRARAIDPRFDITPDNEWAVTEICRRVDGIPLAIELAAARVATLSPRELLDRLTIDVLTSRSPDLERRQQTLRSTIDWSYQLLDSADREMFRCLAIFPGGATMADIEAVIDPEGAMGALDRVDTLVRQSLLWRGEDSDGTSRFHMLETVRAFAQGELERVGDGDELRDRFGKRLLDFLTTANEHIDGEDAHTWLTRIDERTPNVRAVLHWTLEGTEGARELGIGLANAMGWFWYVRGEAIEALRWLALAIAVGEGTDPALRVRLIYYSAAMLDRLGRFGEAERRFEEALMMFRELSDEKRVAQTLNSLGGLAADAGDTAKAFDLLNEAERIMRELGDDYGRAVSLVNLCDAAWTTGAFDRAEDYGRQGLELFIGLHNEWGAAIARRSLAKVAHAKGNLPQAQSHLLTALEGSHAVGDRSSVVRCLEQLAGVQVALASWLHGVRLAGAASRLREDLNESVAGDRREGFEGSLDAARSVLGDEEFSRALEQGSHMTFDQAVEYVHTRLVLAD
jgi:predicted ATPase/class 3 adenylate cyclase